MRENSGTVKKENKNRTAYTRTFDYTMLLVIIILVCIGLVMVYSASYYSAEARDESSYYYFFKQIICAALGTICMVIAMFFDYHRFLSFRFQRTGAPPKTYDSKIKTLLKRLRPYHYVLFFGVLSLLLVYTPLGVTINNSRRWINIGISIQPSEILKMCLIVFMAASVSRKPRSDIEKMKTGVLPYMLLIVVLFIPIIMQPNYSAIICIFLLVMAMLFVAGVKTSHLVTVMLIGAGALAVFGLMPTADGGYRLQRILNLGDPGYQLTQSKYSFGAGGMFGRGLGNSMQKMLYLPMSESDLIFSVIAEELGFFGAVCVLLLYVALIWRGVIAAMRAPDMLGRLIATGVVGIISIQTIINIGVALGIVPTTGVVLPFLSYGGSGVIIFMTMAGFLENVARQGTMVPGRSAVKEKQDGKNTAKNTRRPLGQSPRQGTQTISTSTYHNGRPVNSAVKKRKSDPKQGVRHEYAGEKRVGEKKTFPAKTAQKNTGWTKNTMAKERIERKKTDGKTFLDIS